MLSDLFKRIMVSVFVVAIIGGVWVLGSWKSYLDTSRAELAAMGKATFDLERLATAASTRPSDSIDNSSWGQATVSLSATSRPDMPS